MQFLNKSCSRYNSLKNGELVDMEEVNSLTQRVYFAARLHCCRGRRAYCTQVSLGNMPHTCVRCRKCVFWKCALIHFVGRGTNISSGGISLWLVIATEIVASSRNPLNIKRRCPRSPQKLKAQNPKATKWRQQSFLSPLRGWRNSASVSYTHLTLPTKA